MRLLRFSDVSHALMAPTITALLALALVVSCDKQSETQSKTQTEASGSEPIAEQASNTEDETGSAAAEKPAAREKAAQETQAKKPSDAAKPAKPPAPKVVTLEIPAGMNVVISLTSAIETGEVNNGDEFKGTLVDPIVIANKTVFPAGTQVTGTVLNSVASGRLKTDAKLSLTLRRIAAVEVQTDVIEDKASSHSKRNKKLIGGGAIVGGILGALKGKDVKGAVIGAAAGAAVGTGAAALTGKKNLRYEAGSLLQFTLTESVKANVSK